MVIIQRFCYSQNYQRLKHTKSAYGSCRIKYPYSKTYISILFFFLHQVFPDDSIIYNFSGMSLSPWIICVCLSFISVFFDCIIHPRFLVSCSFITFTTLKYERRIGRQYSTNSNQWFLSTCGLSVTTKFLEHHSNYT